MQRLAVELQQKKGIAGKDGGATQKNLQLYLMATFSSRGILCSGLIMIVFWSQLYVLLLLLSRRLFQNFKCCSESYK